MKLLSLYGLIFLGYITKDRLKLNPKKLSHILLYFILPLFILSKISTSNIALDDLIKPLLVFVTSFMVCCFCYFLSAFIWGKNSKYKNMKYLMAAAVPNANTGYFGIPLAILLFSDDLAALYILCNFGVTLFQLTIGYYLYAKSHMSIWASFMKLFKFPPFWALFVALLLNFSQINIDSFKFILDILANITAILFSIAGMALIGIGLKEVKFSDINKQILIWASIFCFIIWFFVAKLNIFIGQDILGFWENGEEKILILMALCPIGSNAVMYANEFDLYPKQASLIVFITTVLALPILGVFIFYL